MDRLSEFRSKTKKKNVLFFLFRPTKSRAILRFIPMMWIDQTITLNDDVIQRLQRAAKILHRGEKLHRSIRFAYLIVGLFLLGGLIIVIELYLNRRRVERTVRKDICR